MQQWRFLEHRSKYDRHTTSLGWDITIQCYHTAMRQEQSPDRYCNKNGERVREGRKGYETSAVRRKKYL